MARSMPRRYACAPVKAASIVIGFPTFPPEVGVAVDTCCSSVGGGAESVRACKRRARSREA